VIPKMSIFKNGYEKLIGRLDNLLDEKTYDTEYDKEVTELFEKAINNYKEFDFDYYFEKWGETRKRIKKLYWI